MAFNRKDGTMHESNLLENNTETENQQSRVFKDECITIQYNTIQYNTIIKDTVFYPRCLAKLHLRIIVSYFIYLLFGACFCSSKNLVVGRCPVFTTNITCRVADTILPHGI